MFHFFLFIIFSSACRGRMNSTRVECCSTCEPSQAPDTPRKALSGKAMQYMRDGFVLSRQVVCAKKTYGKRSTDFRHANSRGFSLAIV
jgi:hypothetical protein